VSYADISPPVTNTSAGIATGSNGHISKKSKLRNDSADSETTSSKMLTGQTKPMHNGVKFEKSRELTHEEIWDDSALIEAWNAAAEEYEALNGPDKGWKSDPVHKAPLWYNVPPQPKAKKPMSVPSASVDDAVDDNDAEDNSKPLDFDTYVPTYDPSLETSSGLPLSITGIDIGAISQDEAFSHAMNAMYWTGYWTAIYHSRRQTQTEYTGQDTEIEQEVEEGTQVEDDQEAM